MILLSLTQHQVIELELDVRFLMIGLSLNRMETYEEGSPRTRRGVTKETNNVAECDAAIGRPTSPNRAPPRLGPSTSIFGNRRRRRRVGSSFVFVFFYYYFFFFYFASIIFTLKPSKTQ